MREERGRAQSGRGRVRSPLTGAALTSAALIPNHSLRKAIESALEAAVAVEEEAAEEAAKEAEEAEEAAATFWHCEDTVWHRRNRTAEDAAAEAASSSYGGSGGGSEGGAREAGGGARAAESRQEAAALRELAARAGLAEIASKRPKVPSTHLPTLASFVIRHPLDVWNPFSASRALELRMARGTCFKRPSSHVENPRLMF